MDINIIYMTEPAIRSNSFNSCPANSEYIQEIDCNKIAGDRKLGLLVKNNFRQND